MLTAHGRRQLTVLLSIDVWSCEGSQFLRLNMCFVCSLDLIELNRRHFGNIAPAVLTSQIIYEAGKCRVFGFVKVKESVALFILSVC
jgi:hypothetical protein